MTRILIIDDDIAIRGVLANILARHEFPSTLADGERQALEAVRQRHFSLILLDWVLQDGSGADLLRRFKSEPATKMTPIILMSGIKTEPEDEAMARDLGADLFLTKHEMVRSPKGPEGLLRHISALLVGSRIPRANPHFRFDGLEYNPSKATLTWGKNSVFLNPQECALLEIFLRRPNMLHASSFLWTAVWNSPTDGPWLHTLENRISTLRAKLGPLWGRRLVCRKKQGFLFEHDAAY